MKIPKNAGSQEILKKNNTKNYINFDQFFCGLENWYLFYPGQKEVEYIPDLNIVFMQQHYQEDQGKPLSKIDLCLC